MSYYKSDKRKQKNGVYKGINISLNKIIGS